MTQPNGVTRRTRQMITDDNQRFERDDDDDDDDEFPVVSLSTMQQPVYDQPAEILLPLRGDKKEKQAFVRSFLSFSLSLVIEDHQLV